MNSSKGITRSALMLALLLLAAGAGAAPARTAGDVVRQTSEEILAELDRRGAEMQADPARLYALIESKIGPHFDLARMSRYVVGKHWRRADERQRAAFVAEFKTLLVRSYGNALSSSDDFEVVYLPDRSGGRPDRATARIEIRLDGTRSIGVDFRMHNHDAGVWKVYDVVIEGVSLVSSYRSSFSGHIRRTGLEGLIGELRERNGRALAKES